MASIIKFSDIIISRAGAGAIKEFANAGACAILVPFIKGSRGDQVKNANLLENQNACLKIDEDDLNEIKIINLIKEILDNKEKFNIIKQNIKKFHNLVIHIGFLILQALIESIISHLKLLFFNRILGLVLGLLEAFGIIAIVVYIIHAQQIFNPNYFLEGSNFLEYLNPGINYLFKISKT
ncbi:hypothetical protein BDCR2A_00938 [Borrelia duttonii CR2A]|uniref:Glycosyl transferase family 28 C-terminal domain-containing protein n=1 Tax=Borrelia duttonii CR2A TaxID=1432657 RepID=W6TJI6_9SPIR|nr:hypothetical protein BDCR2A_00938 [Borrelia duttonii CR2A]